MSVLINIPVGLNGSTYLVSLILEVAVCESLVVNSAGVELADPDWTAPDAIVAFGRGEETIVVVGVAGAVDGADLAGGGVVGDGEGEVEDVVAFGDGDGVCGAFHCGLVGGRRRYLGLVLVVMLVFGADAGSSG